MVRHRPRVFVWFAARLRAFRADSAANISILFAFASLAIVAGVGGAMDLTRAYSARQTLSQTATLACQYATRSSIIKTSTASYSGTGGGTSYVTNVGNFITSTLNAQNFRYTQTTSAPFSYTQNGPANVRLTASVPTAFMQVFGIRQMPVGASSHCYDTAASLPQQDGNGNGSSAFAVQEGFENTACGGTCFTFYSPTGQAGVTVSSPVNTPSSTIGYTGTNGAQWVVMGYCVEIDSVNIIKSTVPEGFHSAELDCDNGSGTAGNSSISTKTYLAAGNYELRYNYVGRVDYPDYDPVYICGSTANDLAWANSANGFDPGSGFSARTNQINVYFDLNTNGVPPTHTTIGGAQTLGGSNLIDMCVYSTNWVERSVRIKVTTPGYYWLSFAADGTSDSYGGQLDNIRLCVESCTTTLQDNFPSTWLAANNGGVNKVLFEDTFEGPVYTQDPFTSSAHTKGGNLSNSRGTSGSSASGWPSQASSAWATAPYNEVEYWEQGYTQGTQYIALQGWNPTTTSDISTYGYTHSGDALNRSISRPFLLVPGYYSVGYYYTSMVDFSYDFVYSGNYYPVCTAAPTATNSVTTFGMKHGYAYASTTLISQYLSTSFMNVFVANGQLVSTPVSSTALGSAPTYNNPDGTTSSSPTVPIDNGSNFTTYSASAVNPVIDTCYYSGNHAWVQRSVNIKISKPGWYWLTFSALGDPAVPSGNGPALDDVKLTALGSPFMSSPPSTALTTIPVPAPQPDTTYTNSGAFTGFSIVADPFMPPAPKQ